MKNIEKVDVVACLAIFLFFIFATTLGGLHFLNQNALNKAAIAAGLVQQYDAQAKEMKWVKP
jgi:hypothetical protein